MLLGIVEVEAKDGAKDELVSLMNKCADNTRREEGCICYDLYFHQDGGNKMLLFEKWKDRESLSRHSESEHIKETREKSAHLKTKDNIVRFFEV